MTDYEIQGGELVSVDRDQFTREIVSIFIPSGEGFLLMLGPETHARMAARSLAELTVASAGTVTMEMLEFDLQAIDAAFANDQWKRGFDVSQGYIQHGTVYGERIEADPLLNQIRTRSLPNEVGVTLDVTGARMKVRVLRHGRIQFPGVQLRHLEHRDHPNLGDPWPAVLEALHVLEPNMRTT